MLWQFLADDVEKNVEVNDQDKAEFRRIMRKMCRGNVISLVQVMLRWATSLLSKVNEKIHEYVMPPTAAPCEEAIPVKSGSMDWIFQKGALVVPMDDETATSLFRLSTLNPIWSAMKSDTDMEKGSGDFWQVFDCRS